MLQDSFVAIAFFRWDIESIRAYLQYAYPGKLPVLPLSPHHQLTGQFDEAVTPDVGLVPLGADNTVKIIINHNALALQLPPGWKLALVTAIHAMNDGLG